MPWADLKLEKQPLRIENELKIQLELQGKLAVGE